MVNRVIVDQMMARASNLGAYPGQSWFPPSPSTLPLITPPSGSDLIFAHSSFAVPSESALLSPTSSQLTEVRDIWTPAMVAGTRPVFVNWQKSTANGSTLIPANTSTIDYASQFSGTRGAGYTRTLSFTGAKSVTMAAGGFAIADPLPADFGAGYQRVEITTPDTGQRPRTWTTRIASAPFGGVYDGEYGQWFAATQPGLETTGNVATATGHTPTGNTQGYTPALLLAPAGANKAALIFGDSLVAPKQSHGDDPRWACDIRGNNGWAMRGYDQATNGRIALGNFAYPGNSASLTMAAGGFDYEMTLLRYIRDTYNGGRWPFHFIHSGLLVNDFTTLGDAATLDSMWAVASTWWSWLKVQFPGVPIVQNTISTRMNSTDGFATLANQTPVSLAFGALLEAFNTKLVTEGHSALSKVIDLRPAHYTLLSGIPRVPLTPFTIAGGGTLAVAVSGTTNLSNGITVLCPNGPPAVGDYLTVEPGQPGMETPTLAIGSVVATGNANEYLVKTPLTTNLSGTHAIGAIVTTKFYQDQTHWGANMSTAIGVLVDAAKTTLP